MDIRLYTYCIIRKNRQYLKGRSWTGSMEWNSSQWEAWRTRNLEAAKSVAVRTGGVVMLFNTVSGQLKLL